MLPYNLICFVRYSYIKYAKYLVSGMLLLALNALDALLLALIDDDVTSSVQVSILMLIHCFYKILIKQPLDPWMQINTSCYFKLSNSYVFLELCVARLSMGSVFTSMV